LTKPTIQSKVESLKSKVRRPRPQTTTSDRFLRLRMRTHYHIQLTMNNIQRPYRAPRRAFSPSAQGQSLSQCIRQVKPERYRNIQQIMSTIARSVRSPSRIRLGPRPATTPYSHTLSCCVINSIVSWLPPVRNSRPARPETA